MAATRRADSQGASGRRCAATVRHVDATGKMERLLETVLDDYGGADLLLAERMDEIVALRDRRDALEEELAGALVVLDRRDAELAGALEVLDRRSETIAELAHDLDHALRLREEAVEAVRTVEGSTSWRLTALCAL